MPSTRANLARLSSQLILSLLALSISAYLVRAASPGPECITFRAVVVQDAWGPDACNVISGGGTESAVLGGNDCAIEVEVRISNWACVGPDARLRTWQARFGEPFSTFPPGLGGVSQPPCANNDADCVALGFDSGCQDTNLDFVGDTCLRTWQTPTLPNDLLLNLPACSQSSYVCGSTANINPGAIDNGSEYYAMTMRLWVEAGATGMIVFPFLGVGFDTFVIMDDNSTPPIGDIIDATITIPVGRCCGNTCADNVTPDLCPPGTVFEEGEELACPVLTGPGNKCVKKSRYATVEITEPLVNQSIQVTIVSMPLDPAREGEIWRAGPLTAIPNEPNAELAGAPVECEATPTTAIDWPHGLLQLYGPPIVPGSQYEVQFCDASGQNCSTPQSAETGKWGDIVAAFGGSGQPNFSDVTALVDKFKRMSTAPDMVRVDLGGLGAQGVPDTPDQKANFADITSDIAAFKGATFPYAVPACP